MYFVIFAYNGYDIFIIFWSSLSFFEDEKKIFFYQLTDRSLFNRVG